MKKVVVALVVLGLTFTAQSCTNEETEQEEIQLFSPNGNEHVYYLDYSDRFNESSRRTLKVRGAFLNEESVLAIPI